MAQLENKIHTEIAGAKVQSSCRLVVIRCFAVRNVNWSIAIQRMRRGRVILVNL